eukprot:TRINITY_DN1058_c0_g1_i9.p1 TRINITY_DN1058_c0_g1~~TRINITY_DN1058_c0_g1_i9.p1  ORF type:complete len:214 (+),score=23.19 TRINITY_DN1058_c0_g1_i9:1159-1800(+)
MVSTHMRWHGANPAEAKFWLYVWSFLLPGVGFPASTFSALGIDYSNKRTMFGASLVGLICLVMTVIAATIPNTPLWVQTFTFLGIIIWRMNGVTLFNSTLPRLFPGLQYGKVMGLVWSLCGIISYAIAPEVTTLASENMDNFLPLHICFCLAGSFATILLAILFLTDVDGEGNLIGFQKPEEGQDILKDTNSKDIRKDSVDLPTESNSEFALN